MNSYDFEQNENITGLSGKYVENHSFSWKEKKQMSTEIEFIKSDPWILH